MTISIPDSHSDIPSKSQVVILSTSGPTGEPQTTALWFVMDGDTLQMSINTNRQKLKNMERNPWVSAFFIDPDNPYRTLELRGTVSIEPDPDYAFAKIVGEKYESNLAEMDKPGESRVVVTLNTNKIHAFG